MNKRERLERSIAGEPTDRTPVALWRRFPGDDQRASDFAQSIVDFQRQFDWDFAVITPADSFCTADYGVQDVWEGALDGTRGVTKYIISRSLDWTELRALDPARGALGRQLEAVRTTAEGLKHAEDLPLLHTLLSPLTQARMLAGEAVLTAHMRTQADRLHSGLSLLTESVLRYIDALKRLPISGVVYVMDYADYARLSEDEYTTFGAVYDRVILEALSNKWWLNILSLPGDLPMFRVASTLPAQVVNWPDQGGTPSLDGARAQFGGALCGGVARWDHLHQASPAIIKQAARAAIAAAQGRRLILSTGGPCLITSPHSNLRALREAAEGS